MPSYRPPFDPQVLRSDLPLYPQSIQLLRVTGGFVYGPNGLTLYTAFTQQVVPDTLLLRDREPCLVDDSNFRYKSSSGAGLTAGYYNGRLSGSHGGLPLYEVGFGSGSGGGSVPDASHFVAGKINLGMQYFGAGHKRIDELWIGTADDGGVETQPAGVMFLSSGNLTLWGLYESGATTVLQFSIYGVYVDATAFGHAGAFGVYRDTVGGPIWGVDGTSGGGDTVVGGIITALGSGGPTGAAGGSLSGTYPNPSLATSAVGPAELATAAVTPSKLEAGSYLMAQSFGP